MKRLNNEGWGLGMFFFFIIFFIFMLLIISIFVDNYNEKIRQDNMIEERNR